MTNTLQTSKCHEVLGFADQFAAAIGGAVIAGSAERWPRIVPSSTLSTGGGARARSAILLESTDRSEPSLTAGWVDVVSQRAALRSYAALVATVRARFPTDPPWIDRETYEAFLSNSERLLVAHGITVAFDAASDTEVARGPRRFSPFEVALASGVVALLVALALSFAR